MKKNSIESFKSLQIVQERIKAVSAKEANRARRPNEIAGDHTFLALLLRWFPLRSGLAAETMDQLIAGAKKESELTFIAGAQTFGGAKTLAVLEAAFNKRFGLIRKSVSPRDRR